MMENINKNNELILCEGCHQDISNKNHIACHVCGKHYDLECANISEKRLSISAHLKKLWNCPACTAKKPRSNNENIPARSSAMENTATISQDPNVTLRKPVSSGRQPSTAPENNDDSSLYELSAFDESLLGDTIQTHAVPLTQERVSAPIFTLDQLSQLLDQKLERNEKKILSLIKTEIKSLIQDEIKNVMANLTTETTTKFNIVNTAQNKLSNDMRSLTGKIYNLEKECDRLNSEIKSIQNLCNCKPNHNNNNNAKKLVIYGLEESNWETDDELYDRIVYVLHDYMNVYLDGHIDELTRLGKHGHRRPIVMELTSKQMTRYILQNRQFLKGSGIMIDEFLESEALQKRNKLRKMLYEARKEGHHAVIRNNLLIVNGQVHTMENDNNGNNSTNKTIEVLAEKSHISNTTNMTQMNDHNNSFRNNSSLSSGNRSFRN